MAGVLKYSIIENKLLKGYNIKVLLVHPAGPAIEIAENRMYGRPDIERRKKNTLGTLQDLCSLRHINPEKLEIRTIQNPLTYEAVAVNPQTASGELYLKHYVFKLMSPTGSKPKFVIQASDGYWYDFFYQEIQNLWENGTEWVCDDKAKDQQSKKVKK